VPLPSFRDVAGSVGLNFVHTHGARGQYYYPETFGAGAAWLDYDADGWLDLYLVNGGDITTDGTHNPGNELWRNFGADGEAGFVDVTSATGASDTGYGMGVAVADIEADGDPDIFVTNVGANSLLLQSSGHFSNMAVKAGLDSPQWGTGSAFFDADLDGDLDLAVVNYVVFRIEDEGVCRRGSVRTYCHPQRYAPAKDLLYRNDSTTDQPSMTDITEDAGFTALGRGLGLAAQDVDLDGDTDLYVANDGTANFLYRNDTLRGGAIQMEEMGLQAGVHFNLDGRAEAGMGVDFGDIDGDSWPDLVVTNFSRESNRLYQHSGDGLIYSDLTTSVGLAQPSFLPLGFGVALLDIDADGDLDLAVANGHVLDRAAEVDRAGSYEQPDQLFIHEAGKFVDISQQLGDAFSKPRVSRTLLPGDYDNDGDEDLLITSSGEAPRLMRNELQTEQWLTLHLQSATVGNPHGFGSRITVTTDQQTRHLQLQGGGSYLASRPPQLHVGLGASATAQVRIDWVGGGSDEWSLSPGRHLLRQQNGGR
jgi:hypothetical protein